jgi:HK97 family phage prohead protease
MAGQLMPYFISDQTDCPDWAVIKEDDMVVACHPDKESAIAQMVAISIEENIEPGGERKIHKGKLKYRAEPDELSIGDFVRWGSGDNVAQGRITRIVRDGDINVPESSFTITGTPDDPAALIRIYREGEEGWSATDTLVGHKFSTLSKIAELRDATRELPENYRPALAEDVPEGRACGNCFFFNEDRQNEEGTKAWCEKWDDFVDGGYYCNAWEPDEENRDVNQDAPAYMRAAARRGLKFYEQGLAGDGVTAQTIREARAMVNGEVSDDKWVRLAAWIARHLVDLDSPDADPDSEDYPSAGVVAHLLWGSGPTKRAAQRTKDYADSVVARIRAEETMETNNKWLDVARAIALKIDGPQTKEPEVRVNTTELEVRQDTADGMTFTGYASVFNSPSEDLGGFIEYVAPGAFKRSLQSRNEIKLLWNHDTGEPLASLRGGTMQLVEDKRGLKVTATLPNTTRGRDVAELLRTKVIDSMSFGFNVIRDAWSSDGKTRTLESVRLSEVSIVSFPAYTSTTATVRAVPTINPDELADALLRLESGDDLSEAQASLITDVVSRLKFQPEAEELSFDNSIDLLDLKKKQFDLLMKRI